MILTEKQQIFVINNLRLARHIVRKFIKKPTSDDYQDAFLKLCIATITYNPTLGFKFSTYAYKVIKNHIMNKRKLIIWLVSDLDNIPMNQEPFELDYRSTIDFLLKNLTKREKYIIYKRSEKITLRKIAKKLHISYERIRQIEAKALRKIKLRKEKFNIEYPLFTGSQRKNIIQIC